MWEAKTELTAPHEEDLVLVVLGPHVCELAEIPEHANQAWDVVRVHCQMLSENPGEGTSSSTAKSGSR